MPLVLPERMDREDIEKFTIQTLAALAAVERTKIDRQDFSPIIATELPSMGYINDEDQVKFLREAAALVP